MRAVHRLVLAASLSLLGACAQSPSNNAATAVQASQASQASAPTATSDSAKSWLADVESIAAASDNASRRTAIQQQLEAMGVTLREVAFQSERGPGLNLIAEVSGDADAPQLLLGAHADRVDEGTGATDNASGSAAVLALAERFKQHPLAHHRVTVAFWDQEELGLLGAKAYVGNATAPAQYVNFDIFGWGDILWMMTPDPAHPLVAASERAATDAGLRLSAGDQYPPTDHRAFLDAGWPAVSYSLVGKDEVGAILAAYAGNPPDPMPKLMRVIHSEQDTVDQLDPDAAARGIDAVEAALRQWDADAGAGAQGTAASSD